jgi:hypothetical protein
VIPSVYAVAFVLALQAPPQGPVPHTETTTAPTTAAPAAPLDLALDELKFTDAPPTIKVKVIVTGTRSAATTIRATSRSPGWKELVKDVPPLDPGEEHFEDLVLPATLEPGHYEVTLTINPQETQKESDYKNNVTKLYVDITRSFLSTRIEWPSHIAWLAIIGIALVLAVGGLIVRSARAPRAAAATPKIVFKASPVPGTQTFRGSRGAWGEFDVSLRAGSGPSSSSVIEEKERP